MSVHLLLRQSCLGPQSRSVAHILAPEAAGAGAADACASVAGACLGVSAFCSCLCAHPPPTNTNSDNVHATRVIASPPNFSVRPLTFGILYGLPNNVHSAARSRLHPPPCPAV